MRETECRMNDADCITTYTKKRMSPLHPKQEDICIEDIAHALSLMTRANGHFPVFYSVAQHSLWCAKMCRAQGGSRREILICLLHDASEAYLSDITRPVKGHLPAYLEIEKGLQETIYAKFLSGGLTAAERIMMKRMDDACLYYEFSHYMGQTPCMEKPDTALVPEFAEQDMKEVEQEFLREFARLTEGEDNEN